MSNLLLDEQPILVLPLLATIIGLNEAIVLQQVHYWIKHNERKNRNNKEGFYWVYNTFDEWEKQFPFWSGRTIKRTFKKLEDKNLLIVGNYNKKTYDRTKWYRINYKTLESLATSHSDKMSQCIVTKRHDGKGQSGTMDNDKMTPPIPETTTETNTENNYIYMVFEYWNSKGIIKHREMNKEMKSRINAKLKKHTKDELIKAIDNYKQVLDDPNSYWTHEWELQDFMKPNNVTRFVDKAKPLTKYLKNTRNTNRTEFIPMNDRFDPDKDLF